MVNALTISLPNIAGSVGILSLSKPRNIWGEFKTIFSSVSILSVFLVYNSILLVANTNTFSFLALITTLSDVNNAWAPTYISGNVVPDNGFNFVLETFRGICWVEVKYNEEASVFIFSTWGDKYFGLVLYPLLNIVIGSPSVPVLLQKFSLELILVVEPNLNPCPYLPSNI